MSSYFIFLIYNILFKSLQLSSREIVLRSKTPVPGSIVKCKIILKIENHLHFGSIPYSPTSEVAYNMIQNVQDKGLYELGIGRTGSSPEQIIILAIAHFFQSKELVWNKLVTVIYQDCITGLNCFKQRMGIHKADSHGRW